MWVPKVLNRELIIEWKFVLLFLLKRAHANNTKFNDFVGLRAPSHVPCT